jgi:ABC-type lipoprotein export system ATPase subunit
MSLLELDHVCKRRRGRGRDALVLDDGCLAIDPGELVAVWGTRHAGKTSLLRLAAGLDAPDAGTVAFDGHDLATEGERLLGRELAYCQGASRLPGGRDALDDVVLGLLVNGLAPAEARVRALKALQRAGAESLATRLPSELDGADRARVAIAHALALEPRLVLIDEPVAGVDLHQRDSILLLLRSVADAGTAVLMTVGEPTGLTGADQAMTIGEGELTGSGKRALGVVSDLDARRRATG